MNRQTLLEWLDPEYWLSLKTEGGRAPRGGNKPYGRIPSTRLTERLSAIWSASASWWAVNSEVADGPLSGMLAPDVIIYRRWAIKKRRTEARC